MIATKTNKRLHWPHNNDNSKIFRAIRYIFTCMFLTIRISPTSSSLITTVTARMYDYPCSMKKKPCIHVSWDHKFSKSIKHRLALKYQTDN